MKKLSIGTGLFVGLLLTAALTGLLFLGRQLLGLPFVPFDLFNWITRELPGGLVTFGIDLMIDTMRLLGISVADTAKAAEQVMAILMFLAGGALAGAVFFAIMNYRQAKAGALPGLIMGALYGLPQVVISLTVTQSTVSTFINVIYLVAYDPGLYHKFAVASNSPVGITRQLALKKMLHPFTAAASKLL